VDPARGMLCSDAALTWQGQTCSLIGDPTEGAMVVAGIKGGLDQKDVKAIFPRVGTISFSSDR
jgi:magnesium-transporting ATPase (P-type)